LIADCMAKCSIVKKSYQSVKRNLVEQFAYVETLVNQKNTTTLPTRKPQYVTMSFIEGTHVLLGADVGGLGALGHDRIGMGSFLAPSVEQISEALATLPSQSPQSSPRIVGKDLGITY